MAAFEDGERERVYKVLLVGNGLVGKTSFVERYVNNKYVVTYKQTMGADFAVKVLQRPNGETIKLQLWDIQGQERVANMTRVYYKGAAGCVIMFDLGNRKSFDDVQSWKADLDSKVRIRGKKVPCLLLANKTDLPYRYVELDEINAMSKANGFINWIAISVKENKLISQSMDRLVDILIAEDAGEEIDDGSDNEFDGSLLNLTNANQSSLRSCCMGSS